MKWKLVRNFPTVCPKSSILYADGTEQEKSVNGETDYKVETFVKWPRKGKSEYGIHGHQLTHTSKSITTKVEETWIWVFSWIAVQACKRNSVEHDPYLPVAKPEVYTMGFRKY